jgi:peptidyl-prolyl cis-trans isomerase B (cyclophilin B)
MVAHRLALGVVAAVALVSATAATSQTYQVGRIRTRLGEILFVLDDRTPRHKASFVTLAGEHYWDSLTFNRVIKNFVAQGGCPDTPQGFAASPYRLAAERNDSLRNVYGAVAAGSDNARGEYDAGCQIYIVANKQGLARLDGHYTVYGQVIKGMDVVEAIVSVPTDSTNAPRTPIPLHIDVITMTADEVRADTTVGSVRGVVRDSAGHGLRDVQIVVRGTTRFAATDSTGAYVLTEVPVGQQSLVVRRLGFIKQTMDSVMVTDHRETRVDCVLRQDHLKLGPLTY